MGNGQLLSGSSRAPRTLVVANVVYTELLDALAACAAPPSRSAGKRPALSLPTRAHRARYMDACGVCDDEMDVGLSLLRSNEEALAADFRAINFCNL